jgi:hypothetical protein
MLTDLVVSICGKREVFEERWLPEFLDFCFLLFVAFCLIWLDLIWSNLGDLRSVVTLCVSNLHEQDHHEKSGTEGDHTGGMPAEMLIVPCHRAVTHDAVIHFSFSD